MNDARCCVIGLIFFYLCVDSVLFIYLPTRGFGLDRMTRSSGHLDAQQVTEAMDGISNAKC